MIFGVLYPEKIWHQYLVSYICPPHLYTAAILLWVIQKSHFSTVLFILQITRVISEENKLLLPYPPHLKFVTTLPCEMHKFLIFFIFFTRIEYQSTIRTSCGGILLQHGLKFSRAWWTMLLISGKKDWKHVSVQNVVTLNICCNVACLIFHLPHMTTSSYQSHQRLEECNIPSVRWKSWAFYKVVWWHFSRVVGKGVTVCFLLRWRNNEVCTCMNNTVEK